MATITTTYQVIQVTAKRMPLSDIEMFSTLDEAKEYYEEMLEENPGKFFVLESIDSDGRRDFNRKSILSNLI